MDVKLMVREHQKMQTRPDCMKLIFDGKNLEDDRTLEHYAIEAGTLLKLMRCQDPASVPLPESPRQSIQSVRGRAHATPLPADSLPRSSVVDVADFIDQEDEEEAGPDDVDDADDREDGEEEEEEEGDDAEDGEEDMLNPGFVSLEGDWEVIGTSGDAQDTSDEYLGFRATGRPASSSRSVSSPPPVASDNSNSEPVASDNSVSGAKDCRSKGDVSMQSSRAHSPRHCPIATALAASILVVAASHCRAKAITVKSGLGSSVKQRPNPTWEHEKRKVVRELDVEGIAENTLSSPDDVLSSCLGSVPRRRKRGRDKAADAALLLTSPLADRMDRPLHEINDLRLQHFNRMRSKQCREKKAEGEEKKKVVKNPEKVRVEFGPGPRDAVFHWSPPEHLPSDVALSYTVLLAHGDPGDRTAGSTFKPVGSTRGRAHRLKDLLPRAPYAVTVVAEPLTNSGAASPKVAVSSRGKIVNFKHPALPPLTRPPVTRRRQPLPLQGKDVKLPPRPRWEYAQYTGGLHLPSPVRKLATTTA